MITDMNSYIENANNNFINYTYKTRLFLITFKFLRRVYDNGIHLNHTSCAELEMLIGCSLLIADLN